MSQNKQYSIIELALITEPWQQDILDKKMECSRRIYNNMLSMEWKKYKEMVKTKEWRNLNDIIKEELQSSENSEKKSGRLKAAYARKNEIMRNNGFSEFGFISQSRISSKYYQKHISSTMAAIGIGIPMWQAFEKLFFGNGEKISFKKFDSSITLVSDNHTGIRFLKDEKGYYVRCSNRNAKTKQVKLYIKGPNNVYDREMLDAPIKLVRILKKIEKGKRKYYCQLTVERAPFVKMDAEGNPKHAIGTGSVGIALWRGMLCAVSSDRIFCTSLSPDAESFATQRDYLYNKLNHLRKVNNPDNYNEDGTIRRGIVGEDGKRKRLQWIESNHYKKVRAELKELYRKHNVQKALQQNKAIIELLSMGDSFHFADTSFLTLKPEWDENEPLSVEEYKRKKSRRKAIHEFSPSTFFRKLDVKLTGRGLMPVCRHNIPENLYWYQHEKGVSDERLFTGKDVVVEGKTINQTIYRAFLIRHFDNGIAGNYNQKALRDEWCGFMNNLDKITEKERTKTLA